MGVLSYLAKDMTDIVFCGDVIRHIASGEGTMETFFTDGGTSTHRSYRELWNGKFKEQAKKELRFERYREYPSHFDPSCEEDSVEMLAA